MFPLPDVPSKFDPSYWTLVGEWVEDVAGRYLRATENTDAFPATASDLVEHIWSEIRISTNGQHLGAPLRHDQRGAGHEGAGEG